MSRRQSCLQSERDLSIAGMYIHSRQHLTRTAIAVRAADQVHGVCLGIELIPAALLLPVVRPVAEQHINGCSVKHAGD